jgi:hypothetical protein
MFDKIARSDFERPQDGPKGETQGCVEYKIARSDFERRQDGPKGETQSRA